MSESWTFPGAEGKPTQVDIYAVDEEVELFINGASVGRQAVSQNKATFVVTYQPGTIEVVGYRDGKETERTLLTTAGTLTAIRLTADRETLDSAYGDLAYVTVEIVDQSGSIVPYAQSEVSFEVEGAGELIALGTGDPLSEEPYVDKRRKAWQGRLLAVIRSNGQAGKIVFAAQTEELSPAQLQLQTKQR